VGPTKRKMGAVFTGIMFAVGQIILGILAFFIRDYRWLQAAIAAPSLFFLTYWWAVPESARWLVSQKRFTEADAVLRRVARVNNGTLPEKWWEEIEVEAQADSQKSKSAIENRWVVFGSRLKILKSEFSKFF